MPPRHRFQRIKIDHIDLLEQIAKGFARFSCQRGTADHPPAARLHVPDQVGLPGIGAKDQDRPRQPEFPSKSATANRSTPLPSTAARPRAAMSRRREPSETRDETA